MEHLPFIAPSSDMSKPAILSYQGSQVKQRNEIVNEHGVSCGPMVRSAWVPLLSKASVSPPQDRELPGQTIPCCAVTVQACPHFFFSKHGSLKLWSAVCLNHQVLELAQCLLCDTIPEKTLTNVYSPPDKILTADQGKNTNKVH